MKVFGGRRRECIWALVILALISTEAFCPPSLPLRLRQSATMRGLRSSGQISLRMSADSDAMSACARALLVASDHMTVAASMLDSVESDDCDPSSLIAGAGAFTSAGAALEEVAVALAAREWDDATGPLAASATALFQACKSLSSVGNPPVGTALGDSGLELEDAASVQGCIVLAAAAGPAIISAGDFLASAGGAMGAHGLNMQKSGGTYFDAGERLWRAGAAIAEAGEAMESSGMAIENVK